MSIVEVKVPDIGDFKEVEIIELMVKVGDTIKVDQSLVTVESDKASMEIPSSSAGVIKEIKVKVGDKVAEGSLLLLVEGEGAAVVGARHVPGSRAAHRHRVPGVDERQPLGGAGQTEEQQRTRLVGPRTPTVTGRP